VKISALKIEFCSSKQTFREKNAGKNATFKQKKMQHYCKISEQNGNFKILAKMKILESIQYL